MANPLHVPRKRRFVFMLTPLVDVMFLLLIFFMLSSQTAPYSLLQILAAGAPGQEAGPAAPAPQPQIGPAPRGDLVVSIGRGVVRLNGQRVAPGELKAALERFKAAGFASAVVLPSSTSTVQDLVSVLEAFDKTAFGNTRLMTPEPQ